MNNIDLVFPGTFDNNRRFHSYDDRPAFIDANGTKYWYQHGKFHRDNDLPAIIWIDGSKHWYQHGLRHRDHDQPAVIDTYENVWIICHEWWMNGSRIRTAYWTKNNI